MSSMFDVVRKIVFDWARSCPQATIHVPVAELEKLITNIVFELRELGVSLEKLEDGEE